MPIDETKLRAVWKRVMDAANSAKIQIEEHCKDGESFNLAVAFTAEVIGLYQAEGLDKEAAKKEVESVIDSCWDKVAAELATQHRNMN